MNEIAEIKFNDVNITKEGIADKMVQDNSVKNQDANVWSTFNIDTEISNKLKNKGKKKAMKTKDQTKVETPRVVTY